MSYWQLVIHCRSDFGLRQASDQSGYKHNGNQDHGNFCQLALLLGRERFAVALCYFDDHKQGDEQND